MVRLVLATLMVLALLAVVAVFLAGLRAIRREAAADGLPARSEDMPMQKVAFFLLIALILYVSATGGA